MSNRHIGLVVSVLLICCGSLSAELIDSVAAIVDKETILQSDLVAEAAPLIEEARRTASSQQDFERKLQAILSQTLKQAIEYKILYREAEKAGVEVPDKAIEERVNLYKKQYDTHEAFMTMLEEAGETMPEFRDRLRQQIMAMSVARFKQETISSEIVITESDIRQFFMDNKEQFSKPEQAQVHRIFLSAGSDTAERAAVKKQLNTLKQQLAGGADFAALAQEHSEGPEAEEGGAIGWVVPGDLVEELENAIFALEPGAMSDIIETRYGYHLLMVSAKEAAQTVDFETVRTEIEPKLRTQLTNERFQKWINDLRQRSQIKVFL